MFNMSRINSTNNITVFDISESQNYMTCPTATAWYSFVAAIIVNVNSL